MISDFKTFRSKRCIRHDMDMYIHELERLAGDNSQIVTVEPEQHVDNRPNIITLIPTLFDLCPSTMELLSYFAKRLKSAGSLSNLAISAVAICCICSTGYTVSHVNLQGVSAKEMRNIWSHLETARVSSSPALGQWLHRCMDGRSQEGYSVFYTDSMSPQRMPSSAQYQPALSRARHRPQSIGNVFAEKYFGEVRSVKEAMISDMKMLCALRFANNESVPTFRAVEY